MTVEQTAFPQYSQKHIKDDFAKICEVTGIRDPQRINSAVQACLNESGTYEISDVISMLTGQSADQSEEVSDAHQVPTAVPTKQVSTEETPVYGPRTRPEGSSSTNPKSDKDLVDLTGGNGGEQDEIQRAIAESLKDAPGILGGQVSREEQEISRLLEQSLEESKASTKRKRGGDIWFVDPLNPHDRKRVDGWPVGLKNVGNTCWFSAVIQSLFHLPIFRRLVLKFVPPEVSNDASQEPRNVRFMREQRRIFALMVGTKRKYIDPSKAVEILKEAFSGTGSTDSQQDVSEFQHKLLEWLEDAFRRNPQNSSSTSSSNRPEESSSNPMTQLFYGQYRVEGTNEGKTFVNEETFGQFPLQVEGVQDIHASLEAAMAPGEIENLTADSSQKSAQEQWFTRLPPVLTFELSRFQFNQALGRPEKIHNRLEFADLLFMGRYMSQNKVITRQKREEVKKLREELAHLHDKLDKFVHYGSGPKRVPLQDVLKYALEFAQTPRHARDSMGSLGTPPRSPLSPTLNTTTSYHTDVEMDSPKSHTSMAVDSPGPPPCKREAEPPDVTLTSLPATSPLRSPTLPSPGPLSRPTEPIVKPSPRQVSPAELQVLQSCLKRWRTEVESDVKELQEQINRREEAKARMYDDSALQTLPYRLHAVLVHEGQAASGHYWAYVYSMPSRKWLKFNDITVTETTWEELQRESMGGYHNASAYCLMYVTATRTDVLTDESCDGMEGLPSDLRQFVEQDNMRFSQEIEEWDREQAASKAGVRAGPVGGAGDAEHATVGSSSAGTQTGPGSVSTLPDIHARLAAESTQAMITRARALSNTDAAGVLEQVLSSELSRITDSLRDLERGHPQSDPRLTDVLVYLVANDAPRETVIKRAFLEKFSHLSHLPQDASVSELVAAAKVELDVLAKVWTQADEQLYQQWHDQYEQLRRCAYVFCLAMRAFSQERYTEALPYFVCACDMNARLVMSCEGSEAWSRALHPHLLHYFRRQCVLEVNSYACGQFEECEEEVDEALSLMSQLVLPTLSLLSSAEHLDQTALEEVRDKWCHFLSLNLSPEKVEKLQDLLSRLFELPSDMKHKLYNEESIRFENDPNLAQEYEQLVKEAKTP